MIVKVVVVNNPVLVNLVVVVALLLRREINVLTAVKRDTVLEIVHLFDALYVMNMHIHQLIVTKSLGGGVLVEVVLAAERAAVGKEALLESDLLMKSLKAPKPDYMIE